jgi:pectate lyase
VASRLPALTRAALVLGGALFVVGCGDVRLYPIEGDRPEPPIPAECPTSLIGFATLGGGTTGGSGEPVEVTTREAFAEQAARIEPVVIHVRGMIELLEQTDVASNKTILGIGATAGFYGKGLDLNGAENVIIRNLTISKAIDADAITLQQSRRIWIDHCDLFSDRLSSDVDFYDGLVDVTHASEFVTVSWTRFHDHYKTTLVGHSANNADEDLDHLTVTYHHNAFVDLQTGVRVRFGTVHAFNNYFRNVVEFGIVSQMEAAVLVDNNVFENVAIDNSAYRAITTVYMDPIEGQARSEKNLFRNSGETNISMTTTWSPTSPTLIYPYTPDSPESVGALVQACAGVGKL